MIRAVIMFYLTIGLIIAFATSYDADQDEFESTIFGMLVVTFFWFPLVCWHVLENLWQR